MNLERNTRMKLFQEDEDSSPLAWSCLTPGKWDQGQVDVTPNITNVRAGSTKCQDNDTDIVGTTPELNTVRCSMFQTETKQNNTPSRKRKRSPRKTSNKRFRRFWSFQGAGENSPLTSKDDIVYDDEDIEDDSVSADDIRDNALTVKSAVNRFTEERDLIGDGTRTYALPTISGKHHDLKSITPETLSNLIRGDYRDKVNRYEIFDCRYPYEYEGGHIQEASNVYTKDEIMKLLSSPLEMSSAGKAPILIFHCEFSSERAPTLCRFLRSKDREMNKDSYPTLTFPEVYILYGGYSNFFSSHVDFCEPQSYKPMLHKDHIAEVRHFRRKSKSWTAGEKLKRVSRLSLRF